MEKINPRHLSRRGDPDTSKQAAIELVATTIGDKQRQALHVLGQHDGSTSKELEVLSGHSDGEIRKRLPELRKAGLAHNGEKRVCDITGRMAYTWVWGPDPDLLDEAIKDLDDMTQPTFWEERSGNSW